ncbi:hypothetical protein [Mycobacterium sp.]|uniref:hypothetical protein n=1 Tax=Mycobacterium sp. TaxID=1785 RepID=UPI0031D28EDD
MITDSKDAHHAAHQIRATGVDRRKPCICIRTGAEFTVVTFSGEVDASDIDDLSPYACRVIRDCGVLIADLTGSDAITADGLRALIALWSADRQRADTTLVRVMRICYEHMTVVLRAADNDDSAAVCGGLRCRAR